MRTRILESKLKTYIKKLVKESIYDEQWEEEKQMFFDGIRSGNAIVDDGIVAVPYEGTSNSNDPRWIYYKSGDTRLTDDHFYMQHSPELSIFELKDIQDFAQEQGIQIVIPDWKYDEETSYTNPYYDDL